MTVYNISIYHCLFCGRIEHREPMAAVPQCCGRTMTKTCEKTVPKAGETDDNAGRAAASDAAEVSEKPKPR
jgi:hypothetical protein